MYFWGYLVGRVDPLFYLFLPCDGYAAMRDSIVAADSAHQAFEMQQGLWGFWCDGVDIKSVICVLCMSSCGLRSWASRFVYGHWKEPGSALNPTKGQRWNLSCRDSNALVVQPFGYLSRKFAAYIYFGPAFWVLAACMHIYVSVIPCTVLR